MLDEPILGEEENVLAQIQIEPDYKLVVHFINRLKERLGVNNKECGILCGYEAGGLGYSLYHQLTNRTGGIFRRKKKRPSPGRSLK